MKTDLAECLIALFEVHAGPVDVSMVKTGIIYLVNSIVSPEVIAELADYVYAAYVADKTQKNGRSDAANIEAAETDQETSKSL